MQLLVNLMKGISVSEHNVFELVMARYFDMVYGLCLTSTLRARMFMVPSHFFVLIECVFVIL